MALSIRKTYFEDGKIQSILDELKQDCAGKIYSDLIDDQGNQYVDLVLEGGGTLGIALLGYLFILEEMNIRFARTAGTSAGSILALLLASTPIQERKIEEILKELHKKNFNDFVDLYGSKLDLFEAFKLTNDSERLVEIISRNNGKQKSKGFPISTFISKIESGFVNVYEWLKLSDNIMLAIKNKGLAKGKDFHSWLTKILQERDIHTTKNLLEVRKERPSGLKIRQERIIEGNIPRRFNDSELQNNWNPEIAIVSAEITTETKVEFPKHAELFWSNPKSVNPADFVRASMSIPIFFSPFYVKLEDPSLELKGKWIREVSFKGNIPKEFYFVDGGVISNFPINIFHDIDAIPVVPTFGVRIGPDRANTNKILGLKSLLLSIFNTSRNAMDFDFIYKNKDYRKIVKNIDVASHHWLNFNMSGEEKLELFYCGAKAAKEFLKEFDWLKYKKLREEMYAINESERN